VIASKKVSREMNEFSIPYGLDTIKFRLPGHVSVEVLRRTALPAPSDQIGEVEEALNHPLGSASLMPSRHVEQCTIAISDNTRPVPYESVLPPLLDHLIGKGELSPSQVSFLVASGAHPPMNSKALAELLPRDIARTHRVICHNARDRDELRKVGSTSRGTPLWINRHYLEADVRIVVGNVDPHQFVGFTGGAKGVVIGLGGMATIQASHAMMEHPQARMGIDQGNPVREDIDEAGKLIGIDFVLNVVVNDQHQIVRAFAGAPDMVSEQSRSFCLDLAQAEYEELADVVIASPGGYPKDINLYQAQKALAHASQIVRPGGTVILVAECRQGVGDPLYEKWMTDASSLDEVVDRFRREGFQLGAHKAYLFARDMIKAKVLLVSSLPNALAERLFFTPFPTLSSALDAALAEHDRPPRVAILPEAPTVVPVPCGGARLTASLHRSDGESGE